MFTDSGGDLPVDLCAVDDWGPPPDEGDRFDWAEFEKLIARDSERVYPAMVPEPTACPSGPMAAHLDSGTANPDVLADSEMIDAIIGFEHLISWAGARQARLLGEFTRRRATDKASGPSEKERQTSRWVPDEIALALSQSRITAAAKLGQATQLSETLPATLTAWEAGQLDALKVRAICDATLRLDPPKARAVQARVLARAATQTLSQLKAALKRAVLAVDPDGGNERHQKANNDRRVVLTPADDGMATLWACMTAPDAHTCFGWLTALARGLGKDDPRGMDARRVDLMRDLLTGQLTITPTNPAHGDTAPAPHPTRPAENSSATARTEAASGEAANGYAASAAPTCTGPTDTGPTDTGPTGAGPTGSDPTVRGSAETDPTVRGSAETDPASTGPTETGPTRTGPTPTGRAATAEATAEHTTATAATDTTSSTATDAPTTNPITTSNTDGSDHAGSNQADSDQADSDQADSDEINNRQTGEHDTECPGCTHPTPPPPASPPPLLPWRPTPVTPGKPLVQIVIPLTTLTGADDQPAELVGYGPIPPAMARTITTDAIWKRLITDPLSGTLLDHGRSTYRPPTALSDFVRARDQTCRFPPCNRRAIDIELDHTIPWTTDGPTADRNLYSSCPHHHHLKHDAPGWTVTQTPDGLVTWTTPTGHTYTITPYDYRPEPTPPTAAPKGVQEPAPVRPNLPDPWTLPTGSDDAPF